MVGARSCVSRCFTRCRRFLSGVCLRFRPSILRDLLAGRWNIFVLCKLFFLFFWCVRIYIYIFVLRLPLFHMPWKKGADDNIKNRMFAETNISALKYWVGLVWLRVYWAASHRFPLTNVSRYRTTLFSQFRSQIEKKDSTNFRNSKKNFIFDREYGESGPGFGTCSLLTI